MMKSTRVYGLLLVAVGAVLGYLAATSKLPVLWGADDAKPAASANGQQITGVLGSPAATTTISGKELPPPDPKFGGVIKENAAQSKA